MITEIRRLERGYVLSKDDIEEICNQLKIHNSIIFSYTHYDERTESILLPGILKYKTAFIIMLSYPYKCTRLIFGGDSIDDQLCMAILYRGFFHFPKKETHWRYFQEKLNLCDMDAEIIAQFWNELIKVLK